MEASTPDTKMEVECSACPEVFILSQRQWRAGVSAATPEVSANQPARFWISSGCKK